MTNGVANVAENRKWHSIGQCNIMQYNVLLSMKAINAISISVASISAGSGGYSMANGIIQLAQWPAGCSGIVKRIIQW